MENLQKITAAVTAMFLLSFGIAYAECTYVRPCGEAVGIKLYTEGLLVVGISDVQDVNGEKISAARDGGIRTGDIIMRAGDRELNSAEELEEAAKNSSGELSLDIMRSGEHIRTSVRPVLTESGQRLGLWVRDSTAGIGTVTYLSENADSYAALGHGITDVDTGNILSLKSGNILSCTNISAEKSKKGSVGELSCTFDGDVIGDIGANSRVGIFGKADFENPEKYEKLPAAELDEITEGDAVIRCNPDGNGVCEYGIKIRSISHRASADKTLVIEVTDKELISKTGGIVQGMSGSPIIQNGKIVGAVTHVFVNNPVKGYGIFIGNMLNTERYTVR